MRVQSLTRAVFLAACILVPVVARAEGLLYQLPQDGFWVTFDIQYTFRAEGVEQSGQQTMTMASVGKVVEGSEECRWIEFKIVATENGAERLWIRKLLIPVRFLKRGENPTIHVVRGWTQQENQGVEPAVAVHGRWPAFLAGPLQEVKRLPKQIVESGAGRLTCEGEAGWIQFTEGSLQTKVTFENRLHPKAPFGVVSAHMLFEITSAGSRQTIDSTASLVRSGRGAHSELPQYK